MLARLIELPCPVCGAVYLAQLSGPPWVLEYTDRAEACDCVLTPEQYEAQVRLALQVPAGARP